MVVALNRLDYNATYQFQGNTGFGLGIRSGLNIYDDFSSAMRGKLPDLKPGDNTLLVGLAPQDTGAGTDAGAATNWSVGAEVRVREALSFQR